MLTCLYLAAAQNDAIYQDKCRDSTITYNVTLRGGIEAGRQHVMVTITAVT